MNPLFYSYSSYFLGFQLMRQKGPKLKIIWGKVSIKLLFYLLFSLHLSFLLLYLHTHKKKFTNISYSLPCVLVKTLLGYICCALEESWKELDQGQRQGSGKCCERQLWTTPVNNNIGLDTKEREKMMFALASRKKEANSLFFTPHCSAVHIMESAVWPLGHRTG